MRVKPIMLAGIFLAASIRISTAQPYSVNIVGYINLEVPPGLNLIVNQLETFADDLNNLMPGAPDGAVVFRYLPATQTFADATTFLAGVGWYPSSGNTSERIPVGEGFFLRIPGSVPYPMTLVGEVVLDSTNCIPGNYSLKGSIIPQAEKLEELGFPTSDGDRVYQWDVALQQFKMPLVFAGNSWQPAEPSVMVGEGFLIFRNPAFDSPDRCWVRHFSVGPAAPPPPSPPRVASSARSELRIQRLFFPAGQVTLNIRNPGGETYDIEFSSDGVLWQVLATNQLVSQWTGPFSPGIQGYFRLTNTTY